MTREALFAELVYDENGRQISTSMIGSEAHYVVDDDGFLRHIAAENIDRQVLAIFLEQLDQNRDLAVEQTMKLMGQEDLMTKAAIDAQLKHIDLDQIMAQGIPLQARHMLGMMGFRIVINVHGDVVGLEQPTTFDEE